MNKKSIADLTEKDLRGKRVLVRVDFNVPQDKTTGAVTDDTRIKAALPTIRYLMEKGARIILVSHLGRPKGKDEKLKMDPVAKRLSELIGKNVPKLNDCIGPEIEAEVKKMKDGDVILLENVRFYKEEEAGDEEFAKKLACLAEIYVNDAFGTAHRAHASTAVVAKYLPAYAGFLMQKEIEALGKILTNPARPFVAIIGGAKISTKIAVLKNLLSKVDTLVIGGGMVFTFLKARGYEIGKSLFELETFEEAKNILKLADEKKVELVLPVDVVVTAAVDDSAYAKVTGIDEIPRDMIGVDIGPRTIQAIKDIISQAKTIFWNGPLGVFEIDKFARGTIEVMRAIASSQAESVIGGGDSAAAVEKAGLADKMTHVSTGGGASLEFIEGRQLPGVEALKDK
jgi:phosphoglycerate kinase